MTLKALPSNCYYNKDCLDSSNSLTGYVQFSKYSIQPNVIHFICAHAEETKVQREHSKEILHEINSCSDGFVIDTIPPHSGQVTVENTNGFITKPNDILVYWHGFSDNIDPSFFGLAYLLKAYEVSLGKLFKIILTINRIKSKYLTVVADTR